MTDTEVSQIQLRKQKRWIWLLSAALIASVAMLVGAVIKYEIPYPLWRAIHQYNEIPKPTIARNNEYIRELPSAQLTFEASNTSVDSVSEWQQIARAKLHELMKPALGSDVPEVKVVASESTEGVTRETVVLTSFDGIEVPAFLLRPTTQEPRAALLVVPGHSEGIVATAGIRPDYQQRNALVLAQAGYVVLTMEVRGFGYMQFMDEGDQDVRLDVHVAHCLLRGTTALSVTISDLNAGFNYLASRPEVDPEKIGVVGFSSGGKAAIYFAALNEKVRAVVASGCVMSHDSGLRFSRHDAYEVIPGLAQWLEMSDCLGLVAPRPLLVHWGELDKDRKSRTAAFNPTALPMFEAAREIYTAAGAESSIEKSITPDLGHRYDNQPGLTFLARHFPVN